MNDELDYSLRINSDLFPSFKYGFGKVPEEEQNIVTKPKSESEDN